MKHAKRLTRAMKILLRKHGLNPLNWLHTQNLPDKLVVVHRHTGRTREIPWST